MIDVIDILQNSKSRDFGRNAGKEAYWLLCVIAYHQKLVIELGEECLNPFSKFPVSPNRRPPVLLVEPIGDFQRDMCHLKQILLNVGAKITLVAKHQAITILPLDLLKILEVMNVGRSHVIAVDDSAYSADCMELIPVIMHVLGGAVAPGRGQSGRLPAHCAACRPRVLADRDRLRIHAEHIFAPVHCRSYVFADFFTEAVGEFATLIVLAACYKIRELVGALIVQPIKQVVFTVDTEGLRRGGKGEDFQVRELWNAPLRGTFPSSFTRFPANFLNMSRIFPNFTMKLCISAIIVINGLVTTNLLNISNMCTFFIINILEN